MKIFFVKDQVKHIPNILSYIRIGIALLFPFLPTPQNLYFLIFALLTEYFDGFLARKYNCISARGQFLDPLADKLLAFSVGITFILTGKITLSELAFIYTRDIVAAIGFLIIVVLFKKTEKAKDFKPHFAGKLTTTFQYLVFFNILVNPKSNEWLIPVTGFISIIAGMLYALKFKLN